MSHCMKPSSQVHSDEKAVAAFDQNEFNSHGMHICINKKQVLRGERKNKNTVDKGGCSFFYSLSFECQGFLVAVGLLAVKQFLPGHFVRVSVILAFKEFFFFLLRGCICTTVPQHQPSYFI